MTKTIDSLKQLIHDKLDVDAATLDVNKPLSEYGLDSLALIELLFSIEEVFGVDLGDVAPDAVPATVGEIVSLIDSKLQPS